MNYSLINWDLFQECKVDFTSENQLMQYTIHCVYTLKTINIIFSVDSQKALDKTQQLFIIKIHI